MLPHQSVISTGANCPVVRGAERPISRPCRPHICGGVPSASTGLGCLVLLLAVLFPSLASAQARDSSTLSEAEVEQLRDSAYVPADRVLVFIKLLDTRVKSIQDLLAKPRRPGREEDLHDLLEQFTAISDELNDNLDDYETRHRDIRKPLPKLVDSSERWASALRAIPDNETYNLSRKLALQSIRDTREETTKLIEAQRAYFAAHPEAAKADKQTEDPGSQARPRITPH